MSDIENSENLRKESNWLKGNLKEAFKERDELSTDKRALIRDSKGFIKEIQKLKSEAQADKNLIKTLVALSEGQLKTINSLESRELEYATIHAEALFTSDFNEMSKARWELTAANNNFFYFKRPKKLATTPE